MVKRMPGHRRGLSLVEILVVVAIIATLIALTASTLIRSKQSARRAEATAYGRQIGAAHAMYAEDNNGFLVYSAMPLVRSGYLPNRLATFRDDPYPNGAACDLRRETYANETLRPAALCEEQETISWIGLDDYAWPRDKIERVLQGPEAGPVALVLDRGGVLAKRFLHSPCEPGVKVLRVRFDTSVVMKRRFLTEFIAEDGKVHMACKPEESFVDPK